MSQTIPPRVRIAPSPTGDPHVGTGYMALFNLAFARRHGGTFLLRIEDTDRVRYNADSEQRILEALDWLGLPADEGPEVGGPHAPYQQSQRLPLYASHAGTLVASGRAYPCFCTRQRLDDLRANQAASKGAQGYDRLCRAIPPADAQARVQAGEVHVIRMAMPTTGQTSWNDLVRGNIVFENAEIDDQVLMKADGFPTYHLAVIVDDHLMGITHVIRGEEWISSTPKHLVLYEASGWEPPIFAHMPLLRRPGGAKISKRKDPTNLLWFRDQGYLPEALRNFLGNMGCSMSGDREIYTLQEMFAEFDFARVKSRGPEFDLAKLDWMNGEYIRALAPDDFLRRAAEFMARIARDRARFEPPTAAERAAAATAPEKARLEDETARRATLRHVAQVHDLHAARPEILPLARPEIRERLKTWADLAGQLHFLYEELVFPAESLIPKKGSASASRDALDASAKELDALPAADWNTDQLDARCRALAQSLGLKVGDLFLMLRVATTFSTVSPPLFQSMAILGRDECLRRIRSAVSALGTIQA